MPRPPEDKPPYRLPTMDEVRSVPPSGLKVVSTFSGCGGSCLGYRMAGFDVLWASEFVPAARETYLANWPGATVDDRDIREVSPGEILDAIGMAEGELDVLDGSPPCASFSSAGRRQAGWGKVKPYSGRKQRTDDLFFEYARVLEGLRPRVFVAENVSGLVRGAAKGYFKEILARLQGCGYRVAARLLDAQWLGVPQSRRRLIFVGVREDLGVEPAHPRPLPYRYSIADACPWIDSIRWDGKGSFNPISRQADRDPSLTITVENHSQIAVADAPDISGYAIGREWATLPAGAGSDRYFNLHKVDPSLPSPAILACHGVPSVASPVLPGEPRKFTIAELRRICGFPDDFILTGSYTQQWERLGRAVPPPMMMRVAATLREEVFARCAG